MCRVFLYHEHTSASSGRPETILDAMSWVTIIWAMIAFACLTLALVHFWRQRKAWANLLFSVIAVATAAFAGCELWMMRAETPAAIGMAGAVAPCARLGGVRVAGRIRAVLSTSWPLWLAWT
jgi:hypothetical protein